MVEGSYCITNGVVFGCVFGGEGFRGALCARGGGSVGRYDRIVRGSGVHSDEGRGAGCAYPSMLSLPLCVLLSRWSVDSRGNARRVCCSGTCATVGLCP